MTSSKRRIIKEDGRTRAELDEYEKFCKEIGGEIFTTEKSNGLNVTSCSIAGTSLKLSENGKYKVEGEAMETEWQSAGSITSGARGTVTVMPLDSSEGGNLHFGRI